MVNAASGPPGSYVIPATSPVALPNDAWGNALVYNAPNAATNICPGAITTAFTLTSMGIDGVSGLNPNTNRNDDLVFTVPPNQIQNQIITRYGTC